MPRGWRKGFYTAGNPLMVGDRDVLEPQRGEQKQVYGRQNGENSPQKSAPTSTHHPRILVYTPAVVKGTGSSVSGFRRRPQGKDWDQMLWRYSVNGASTTHLRESRKKPGPAREAINHYHGDPLTPYTCRWQNTTFVSARVRAGHGGGLQSQRWVSQLGTGSCKSPHESKSREMEDVICSPRSGQASWLLPSHMQVPEGGHKTPL